MAKNYRNPLDPPNAEPKSDPQSPLTDTQVDRIELAMQLLSARSANHIANAFRQALEPHKNRDDKRKIVAVIYAQMYESMLAFQMAMDSTKTIDEIRAALKVRDAQKVEKKAEEDPKAE